MGQIGLEMILGSTYQGLFLNGFDEAEIYNRGIGIGRDQRFFIPCLNDATRLQVRALNKEQLENKLKSAFISVDDQEKITALFDVGKMSDEEIRQKAIAVRPFMGNVFAAWDASSMKSFRLTSVGMAIGHANIKRLVGEFADLSIWIN